MLKRHSEISEDLLMLRRKPKVNCIGLFLMRSRLWQRRDLLYGHKRGKHQGLLLQESANMQGFITLCKIQRYYFKMLCYSIWPSSAIM